MRPKTRDELRGGVLPFLAPLLLTLGPMAIDFAITSATQKKEEAEQRRLQTEADRAYNQQLFENEKAKQEEKEYQRQLRQQQEADTKVAQQQRRDLVRTQQSQAVQRKLQQKASDQQAERTQQHQAVASVNQRRMQDAQRGFQQQSEVLTRVRSGVDMGSRQQADARARQVQAQEVSFNQRMAVGERELGTQQSARDEALRRLQDQQTERQRLQQEVIAREVNQRIQQAEQEQGVAQPVSRRIPTKRVSFARTGRVGRGVDAELLAFLQSYYGISLKEAKTLRKQHF